VTIEHLTRMMNHSDPRIEQTDCFLHAGTSVLEGSGRYVVTAVSKIGESTPLRTYMPNVFAALRTDFPLSI
jgi:hypothetical protein